MKNIHYLGIRHHGVGSSKRLLSALDRLQPKKVLIEGASDCTDLLPLLAHADMRPPVALLAYASDFPECHYYYPFAEFSPEYQAILWAVKHGAEVAFIDLPVAVNLALDVAKIEALNASEQADDNQDNPDNDNSKNGENEENTHFGELRLDPIGVLGKLAGFEDGESFWNDVFEQSGDEASFEQIHQMMRALRQKVCDEGQDNDEREAWREAFMRQEIRKHSKDLGEGDRVAVVCGAWHVPALDEDFGLLADGKKHTHTAKSDTAILKNLPKKLPVSKVKTTWIPYTTPRLANRGYGAGVDAPMWYQHLWQNSTNVHESWLVHIASVLRERGQVVSTASVIEATRLATSLAVVRGRRVVGFEELREAVVACLCFGESLVWEQIADEVLLGKAVGSVPSELPLAPLLEDLERLKKHTKLKAEAIPKEVDFDLRSEIGLKKSHLLHRLAILGVNWGEPRHTGSRGTFRERWGICWEPEFAVALVENLVYGNTIFEASKNRLNEKIAQTTELDKLAHDVQTALNAGLDESAMIGIRHLSEQATHTDNVLTLLKSLSPLIHLERYGTARKVALDKVGELVYELTVKASVGLPYAIKNINDDEAGEYHQQMNEVHTALKLTQNNELGEVWWQVLHEITVGVMTHYGNDNTHPKVAGLATRLLYQADKLRADELMTMLQKTLSPAVGASSSARFFEGFFSGASAQLIYDEPLLNTLENWLLGLDEGDFTEFLPLFRRVFGELDSMERKRLMEVIFGGGDVGQQFVHHDELGELWEVQLANLMEILA